MAVGFSDGTTYKDESEWLANSRPSDASTIPLGSTEKPAGALNPSGGGEIPEKAPVQELPEVPSGWEQFKNDIFGAGKNDIRPALGHFYESVKNALQLPGDVYSGKVPAGSVQEMERAADLAGLMVMGPAPVARSMADGTLGSFMGVTSKTFDKNRLAEAQIMKANGAHPDEIWNKTETFQGADMRWRQEISDSTSKLKDNPPWALTNVNGLSSARLEKVLDHPELYAAYPWLKDAQVFLNSFIPEGNAQVVGGREIHLGLKAAEDKGTILHEIQHVIQEREGFAKGGQAAQNYALRFEDDVGNMRADLVKIQTRLQKGGTITAEEQSTIDKATKLFELDRLRRTAGAERAYENYLRLAGEVEARNVETRMLLNTTERRNIPPSATEDTYRHQQIVSNKPLWTTPYGATEYPKRPPKW